MAGILLFILAGITLLLTLFSYLKKRGNRKMDDRSDYLRSAAEKLRGHSRTPVSRWQFIFQSSSSRRRDYYRNEYLQSDAWKRKRYVVLRRDNWRCVYCGAKATQVHHTRYAKRNIGKEPIEWLVSICKPCHDSKHR